MEERSKDRELADDQQALDVGGAQAYCPFVLSFTNLTYSLKKKKKSEGGRRTTKLLLSSITGEARGGEILAVLGASGSGKSTLIDALANRIASGSLEGSVTLNGEPFGGKLTKSASAYVAQDDLLFPMLTVEETLTFAAEFRLPRSLPAAKKKARVQALIDRLGLRSAANTIVGDESRRGASGGERRRASIGTSIVHDPAVLFLDEPTSGLDSASAFAVVKALRRVARGGSVLVVSVHQPSSRILGLLDSLLLISQGQTVYFGPPEGLPPYFSAFGHPIPDNANPAEYALDVVRELESSSAAGPKPLVEFNNSWQSKRAPPQPPRDGYYNSTSLSGDVIGISGTRFANPFWIETSLLARRSFANSCRVPELYAARLAGVLVTGLILATVFWKLDDSPKGARERFSLFAFVMSTVFYACVDALPAFLQERRVLAREAAHDAYRRSSYVLASAAVGLPPLLVLSAALAAATFFAAGLAGGAPGFCFFFLTIFASFWAGSSFVTFLSAAISHVVVGYTVAVGILAYFLLFSGFFINRRRMSGYWIWLHYLSLVKYPYQAVLRNEFDHGNKCFARGVQMFDGTAMGALSEAAKARALAAISGALGVAMTESSCVTTGVDVLEEEGVMDLSKWSCLWITVAWGLFFRVLFYLALLLGSKNKRW